MVNLGHRLRALRIQMGLTQLQLSERLWVSKAMISSYELDQRTPSYEVLIKIAKFFNVSTDYLLGLDKPDINYDNLTEQEVKAVSAIVDLLRKKENA